MRAATAHSIADTIGFDIRGNENLLAKLDTSFYTQLKSLLARADIAGKLVLYARTAVKGTPHTKGLRLRSPDRRGVVVTGHYGGNDSCVEMLVYPPRDMDVYSFHARLKRIYDQDQQDSELGDNEQPAAVPHVLAIVASNPYPNQGEPATNTDILPNVQLAPAVVNQSKGWTPPVDELSSSSARMLDDADVELFMISLAPRSNFGEATVAICSEILVTEHRYARDSLGPVYRKLITRGHLIKVDKFTYRMGETWLERFFPMPAKEPESEPAQVVAPAVEPVEEPIVAQAVPAQSAPTSTPSAEPPVVHRDPMPSQTTKTRREQFEQLERRAHIAKSYRARLDQLQPLIAGMQATLTQLVDEQSRLERKLKGQDLIDAEERYESVLKVLG